MLIEGPVPSKIPDVHPHSVEGALVSITAMWRLPVLHATDAGQSCRLLQFLADQASESCRSALVRYERKPKRIATRRLFVLQGLPGIGPELARRLLSELGLGGTRHDGGRRHEKVPGVGPKTAARIRDLVRGWTD